MGKLKNCLTIVGMEPVLVYCCTTCMSYGVKSVRVCDISPQSISSTSLYTQQTKGRVFDSHRGQIVFHRADFGHSQVG